MAQEKSTAEKLPVAISRRQAKKRYRLKHTAVKNRKLALFGLVLAGFLVGVLITFYYTWVSSIGYSIDQAEKQVTALRIENAGLEEGVSRFSSLGRIEALATQKLGMIRSDDAGVLVVNDSNIEKKHNMAGQETVGAVGKEQKSRFIQAFISLVDRLERKD
jgi:cell division protein FtsL